MDVVSDEMPSWLNHSPPPPPTLINDFTNNYELQFMYSIE